MPRPDEGLIHAWLDGQLPPDEATRVEQLAATDPEWATAVAEARGLIAASSRILASLDHAPSGVIPERKDIQPVWRLPRWAKIAAAIVVVAGGSMLVTERANVPELAVTPAVKPTTPTTPTTGAPTATAPATAPASAPAPLAVAPAEKKTAAVAAPVVQGLADAAVKGKESAANVSSLAANAPAMEARQKLEAVDRAGLTVPPPSPTKDAAKAGDATQRVALEPAPTAVGGVATMRTSAGAAMPARAVEPAVAELQARRVSGGVAAPAQAKTAFRDRRCYRVREPAVTADAGVIMRLANTDGDTLRLESAQGASGLRAWIVWRDSLGHGAMTAADGKGAIPIVATAAACPTP